MGDVLDKSVEVVIADPAELAWKELSDLGNAERLVARAGGKLLHVPERGWVAYDGVRWSAEDGQAIAHRLAHNVARSMREEFLALTDAIKNGTLPKWATEEIARDRKKALHKWGIDSGNANKTRAMLSQAESLITTHRDTFDPDPMALNCRNGTLRFVQKGGAWRVEQSPHDPADRISRVTECDYDPAAAAPLWEEHLATVLPDRAVRDFFQEVIGYSLVGMRTEQAIVLLQGRGGDGKSTTMNALRETLGGYASAADVQTFMAGAARSGADASPDLARLAGDVRLCSTGEPRRGGALDEAKIKAITGGSPVTARELHGTPFEYVPRFLLVLECNAKPRISGDDDGIWRRILIIMFPHQFDGRKEGTEPDKRIQERLIAEGPGILNWAIAGCLRWLERGRLDPPDAVKEAVEDYRKSANPFGEWFHERLDTRDPGALVAAKALRDDYLEWCEANGVADREVMTTTAFGRALGDRQILKGPKDSSGCVRRRGATLRPKDGLLEPPATQGGGDPGWSPYHDEMEP